MIVRYVRPLTENQRHTLAEIMKHDAIPRARVRAHGILLSAQGMRIKEIAKIYQVDRDTVATWIKKWEQRGIASLYDKPRSGIGCPNRLLSVDRFLAIPLKSPCACRLSRRPPLTQVIELRLGLSKGSALQAEPLAMRSKALPFLSQVLRWSVTQGPQ